MKTPTFNKPSTTFVCLLLLAAGLFSQPAFAQVTLPFYDEFPASLGTGNLGPGGVDSANWTLGANTPNITVSSAFALTPPAGLQPPAGGSEGVQVTLPNIALTPQQDVGVQFGAINSGAVYVSFLLQVNTNVSVGTYKDIVCLNSSLTSFPNTSGKLNIMLNNTGTLTVNKAANTSPGTTTAALGTTTHLVVARYTFNPALTNDDTVDLWLDPPSSSFGAAAAPTATVGGVGAGTSDASSLQVANIHINTNSAAAAGAWFIDEFRVGTSWAAVTPSTAGPASATYYTSIATGNWANTNTWAYFNGFSLINPATVFPAQGDTVTNNVGHTVTLAAPNSASFLDVNGTVSINTGVSLTATNVQVESGGTLAINGSSDTIYGTLLMNGGSITGSGGTLYASNYVVLPGGASPVTVSANLAGTGGLTASNSTGTLILSGTNTYGGLTKAVFGTVQVNSTNALSGASTLTTGGSSSYNGTLNLNTSDSAYTMNSLSLGGIITVSGPAVGSAPTLTFTNGGVQTGTGNKNIVLQNANAVVNSTFDLSSTTGTPGRSLSISGTNGETLTFNGPVIDNNLNGTNAGLDILAQTNPYVGVKVILNGNNSYTGTNIIEGGTLQVSGPSSLPSGSDLNSGASTNNVSYLNLASAGTYNLNHLWVNGVIRFTGPGSGLATLNFANGGAMLKTVQYRWIDVENNVAVNINGSGFELGPVGSYTINRIHLLMVNGALTFNAPLTGATDGTYVSGYYKTGNGVLTLAADNTYSGPTIISQGTLALTGAGKIEQGTGVSIGDPANSFTSGAVATLSGTGTIAEGLTINTGCTLAPGTASAIGTLTASGGLTNLGNLLIKVNKSQSPSNDLVSVTGACLNGGTGTLTVTNLSGAPALVSGDRFVIFSQPLAAGNTMNITGGNLAGGLAWSNSLAIDGSIKVVGTSVTPPTLNLARSGTGGTTLTFSWTGAYKLQSQTNGLSSTGWSDYPGGGSSPVGPFTIDPAQPRVFFRLKTAP